MHIQERKEKAIGLTRQNLVGERNIHHLLANEDTNLYALEQKLKRQGMIEQDKILNLDIDNYYNSILNKQSVTEMENMERIKLFKMKVKERKENLKLPFEKNRKKVSSGFDFVYWIKFYD